MHCLNNRIKLKKIILLLIIATLAACAASNTNYHDPDMDFSALRTVAVLPFANLTRDKMAGARVKDLFANSLLSTGVVYVVPTGEVARSLMRIGVQIPTAPSSEEIVKLGAIIKVDAVITGTVREYGEVKSGSTAANVISLGVQMIDTQSRKVVWAASSTKGGITFWDRLLGGGGELMKDVTKAAVDDVINKLFD